MKRGKAKEFKPDLIITADWHLMEKERNPPCRTDSHWEAQWDKVGQIFHLQKKYKCPIKVAGDIFEHWKTSPQLLNECICRFPRIIDTVIGNHDMPQHNIDNMARSGLQTLTEADIIEQNALQGDWGFDTDELGRNHIKGRRVIVAHMMVWKGDLPWPGCEDPEADEVFDIFPDADLIITGHNHKTFTAKRGKRLLINPGSLTRHKADQVDHKPCVFLWEAKTNTFKIHYLKIKKDVISRDHIEVKKSKEKRIEAFISKLKEGWDVSLSFEDNMSRAIKKNKIPERLQQIIYKWMGV